MKYTSSRTVRNVALLAALFAAPNAFAQWAPERVPSPFLAEAPYNSAGVLFTEIDGNTYRGSAAVARDERLLYTCAHVFFDRGVWADDYRFARAWNDKEAPDPATMVPLRGFRYHAGYSGGNSEGAFSKDFAIGFRNNDTSFGPALPAARSGVAALSNISVGKLIVGYPASFMRDGTPGYYYQHETGPYYYAMDRALKSYHVVDFITTGKGNSGGPVVSVIDTTYRLIGILISGSPQSTGIYGLNKTSATIASLTLLDLESIASGEGYGKRVRNSASVRLPDASKRYVARNLEINNGGDIATSVKLNLRIDTSFRGDLDVYVRSPTGRVHWMQRHARTGSGINMELRDADMSSTFFGANPNGKWTLFMRDFYHDDRATFKHASIAVKARDL